MWPANFCFQDEVVKYSPHARAIRDVEDEELRSFFCGMSPWQVHQVLNRLRDQHETWNHSSSDIILNLSAVM